MAREYLSIDTSSMQEQIDRVRGIIDPERANEIIRRTLVDTSRYVRTIVTKDVAHEYAINRGQTNWVRNQIAQYPNITDGGMTCIIPIKGVRGILGEQFRARAGRARNGDRRRRTITVQLVRGVESTLPDTMAHQGGHPPFMINGRVYTRSARRRRVRVPGLSVPQMPVNRSEEEITAEVLNRMEQRLNHHIDFALRGGL